MANGGVETSPGTDRRGAPCVVDRSVRAQNVAVSEGRFPPPEIQLHQRGAIDRGAQVRDGVREWDQASLDYAVSLMVEAMEVLDNMQYPSSANAVIQSAVDGILIETGQPLAKGMTPKLRRDIEEYLPELEFEVLRACCSFNRSVTRAERRDIGHEPGTALQSIRQAHRQRGSAGGRRWTRGSHGR